MASKVACCEPVAEFARHLRQAGGRERGEHQGMPPVRVEEIDQRIGDVLLVDVEAAGRIEIEREIQVDVVGVVAEA